MDRRALRPLIYIIPAALIIKLVYLLFALPDSGSPAALSVDALYHYRWAMLIADGEIFANAPYFRAPLYPFFLALLLKISGADLVFARLVQLLAGAVFLVYTYLLALKLFNRTVAAVAPIILLLYPLTTYFETELLLDPLFSLLALMSLYYFIPERDGRIYLIPASLLFGLAALTRPVILVFVPVVIFYLLVRRQTSAGKFDAKRVILFLAIVALTILPIAAVNYAYSGQIILVSYQGGINFYIGNNPEADGLSASLPPYGRDWTMDDASYLAYRETGQKLNYGRQSNFWYRKGLAFALSDFESFAGLYLKKLYYVFSGHEISNNRPLHSAVFDNAYLQYFPVRLPLILALAVIPLIFYRRRENRVLLPYGLIAIYGLTIAAFFINSRFRLPLLPLLSVLAALGVTQLFGAIRNRRFGYRFFWSMIAAVGVFAVTSFDPYGASGESARFDLYLKGNQAFRAGDYTTAITRFDSLARTGPYFKNSYLNLGNAYLKTGDIDAASAAFRQELIRVETAPEAANNIGVIYLLQEHPDSALDYFARALDEKPHYLDAAVNYMRAASKITEQDRLEMIEAGRNEIRDRFLDEPVYLFEEGLYLAARQRLYDAIDNQLRALELLDRQPPGAAFGSPYSSLPVHESGRLKALIYYQLGYLHGLTGAYETSVGYSRQAIHFDADMKPAYINLVSGYRAIGDNGAADSVVAVYRSRWPEDFQKRN